MQTIPAKKILHNTKSSAWFGTDFTINLYRGCSHNCIYCDSRSACYGIEDFEVIKIKENALALLESELKQKRIKGIISLGSMSDPYNPLEQKHLLTRGALKLLNKYQFGVALATKSPLVIRDIDLFKAISNHSPVLIKLTITTADDHLSKLIEPGVAPSSQRFEAIRALSSQGIFCGLLLMPVLPFITDSKENIKKIIKCSKENGAAFIYPGFGVTLRDQQRLYYYEQLEQHFPGIRTKYLHHFGNHYQCGSLHAHSLYELFKSECQKNNLLYTMPTIIKAYHQSISEQQISFLD